MSIGAVWAPALAALAFVLPGPADPERLLPTSESSRPQLLLQPGDTAPSAHSNAPRGGGSGGSPILDQPPNQTNGVFADASCEACGSGAQVVAEQFAVLTSADTVVLEVVFHGGYFPDVTPLFDLFTLVVHDEDAAGLPGLALAVANPPCSRELLAVDAIGGVQDEFRFTCTVELPLPPGAYWLELFHSGGGPVSFFLETGSTDLVAGEPGLAYAAEAPGAVWDLSVALDVALQIRAEPGTPFDSLRVEDPPATTALWQLRASQATTDVIRGLLGNLQFADGGTDLGPVVCVEDDSPDGSTAPGNEDSEIPDLGESFFYLANFDGAYGSSVTAQRPGSSTILSERSPGADDCPLALDACDGLPDGTICDDGRFCTVDESCEGGVCKGAVRDCGVLGGSCRQGLCNEIDDSCMAVADPDGTLCAVDSALACEDGVCILPACSADNPTGSCPPGTTCQPLPDTTERVCLPPPACGEYSIPGICAGGPCPPLQRCDLASCTCQPAEPLPTPVVRFLTEAGTTFCSQPLGNLLIELEPPHDDDALVSSVVWEYSVDGGSSFLPIDDGDAWPQLGGVLEALWDLTGVPAGPAIVRATVTDVDGNTGSATLPVVVDVVPAVVMELKSFMFHDGQVDVTLQGTASDPEGKLVEQYEWDLDNGTFADGPAVTTTYDVDDAPIVALEVHDPSACATTVIRDVVIGPGNVTLAETTECGCDNMTLKASGTSAEYCVYTPAVPILGCKPTNSGTQCPDKATAVTCPLFLTKIPTTNPAGSKRIGWGFEIEVELSDNTNDPSQCEEGQYSANTRILDGVAVPARNAVAEPATGDITLPNGFKLKALPKYPPFGSRAEDGTPEYGPDGYTKPSVFKHHLPRMIRWYDQPTVVVPCAGPPGLAALYITEFVSFVTGTTGRPSCWCRFALVRVVIRSENGLTTTPGLALIDGYNSNCVP